MTAMDPRAMTTPDETADEPKPQTAGLARLRDWLGRLRPTKSDADAFREEIEELLEEQEASADQSQEAPQERTLLRNVLKAARLRVDDVMVPRADVIAVADDTPLDELVRIAHEAAHSRLPVYHETLDDVVGMLHIKDLLGFWETGKPFDLKAVLRKTLFVPPSLPVLDLLLQMRAARVHMAMVVDEYGGIDGLVTIEDLVEQIVGEIEDEHDDEEEAEIIERPDGAMDLAARLDVQALEEKLGMTLLDEEDREDVDTVGGLVASIAGRLPRRGEVITHPMGLTFEVIDADLRRIKRLRLRPRPAPEAAS